MKDSKRIDNKAKSRRIAAYALAGCMAITAAPITMPPEAIEATTTTLSKLGDGAVTLNIKSKVSNATTFAEVASKLSVTATQAEKTGTWADKAVSVTIKDNEGNLVWNTAGDTSMPGTTKIGYGKTYQIEAEFERTIALADGSTEESIAEPTDGTGINATKKTAKYTGSVVFYPTSGMLKNEKETTGDNDGNYIYVKADGTIKEDVKDGLYQNSDGWYRVVDGVAATSGVTPTLEKNSYGTWYVGANGKVDFTKSGLFEVLDDSSATRVSVGWYYLNKGKVDTNKTGLVQLKGTWYNVVKGKVEDDAKNATVVKDPNGKWIYIGTNGESDWGFNGLAKNTNGTWYIKNGVVDFTKEGPVEVDDADGRLGTGTTYFLSGGKVQSDKTGILFYDGSPYYVEKGVVGEADFDEKKLAYDAKLDEWRVIDEDGSPSTFSGLVKNEYGTWVTYGGVVDFDARGIVSVDEDNAFYGTTVDSYYVEGGKVQTQITGIYYNKVSDRVYNLKAGKLTGLDIDKSVVKASNGKWYAIGDEGFTTYRLSGNAYGIWMPNRSNIIDFKETGFHVVTEDESKLSGISEGDVVYIKDGKFQNDVTGLVTVKRDTLGESANTGIRAGAMVYVKNGVVCDDASLKEPTVVLGSDGIWYYVDEAGKTDLDYDGIAKNQYGTWYVNDGVVDFNATGFYTEDDKTYYFVNSKLATDKTGLVTAVTINTTTDTTCYVEKGVVTAKDSKDNVVQLADGAWYYIDDAGKTDDTFDGFAENKYGVWYIEDGKVNFNKTGIVRGVESKSSKIDNLDDSSAIYVVNGKAQLSYSGFVVDGGDKALFEKGQLAQNDDPQVIQGTDKKWYYVQYGDVQDYTGLADNKYGVWYIYKGVVSFNKTGIITTEAVDSAKLDAGEYYVANGKMSADKTGIVKSGGERYYVSKSAVVKGIEADERVVNVDNAWYCINEDGKVFTPKDGLAENENGVWFIKDGKVDFTKKALITVDASNDSPTLTKSADPGQKVYVSGGKFQDETTCVYVDKTTTTYVKNGVETTDDDKISENTVVKGTDGKFYAVQPATANNAILTTGLAKNEDKEVVYVNNKVVSTTDTLIYSYSASDGVSITNVSAGDDILILNGKFASDKTDIVKVKIGASYEKVYVKKGVCTEADPSNSLVKVEDTFYYLGTPDGDNYVVISNSDEVIGTFNGVDYYVNDGVVRNVNRTNYEVGGSFYNIKDGKATKVAAEGNAIVRVSGVDYVMNNGAVVPSAKTTIDGVDYLSDTEGKVLKATTSSDAVQSADGSAKYVVDAKGAVQKYSATEQIVTVLGGKYALQSNGQIETDGVKVVGTDITTKLFSAGHALEVTDGVVTDYSGIHSTKVYKVGVLQEGSAEHTVVTDGTNTYLVNASNELETADEGTVVVAADDKAYVYGDANDVSLFSGVDSGNLYKEGVLQKATAESGAVKEVNEKKYVVDENGAVKKATSSEAIFTVLTVKYAVDTNGEILADGTYIAVASGATDGQINSTANEGATITVNDGVATITPAAP